MAPSANTESHIAAQSTSSPSKRTTHPAPDESSDAETEPLPYDDTEHDDRHSDIVMDPNELAHHAAAAAEADADAPGEVADVSMDQSADHPDASQTDDLDADHSDEQGDDNDEEDALPTSQPTNTQDPNSNMSSPQKSAGFAGDDLDDESELTDEEEDRNEEEDNSSLSDDDLGGSDDEEDEEEEEEDDDDDQNSKTHEDEAAEALAALTGGAETAGDAGAAAGLDALAALATAGDAEADNADEEDEDDDDEVSEAESEEGEIASENVAKPGRLQQLRQEADGDDLSSDITPEPEEGELDGAPGAEDASDQEEGVSPRTTDLDLIASMKKRAAATGGATSLLEPEQLVDSLPGSAASSRAASPLGDEDEEADKLKAAEDAEADADGEKAPEAEQAEAEHLDTATGTPAPDAAEHDDDASTDEAAIRRQEAMEALTKIEIGFAMLRDRLYVERLQEISKEGEMILDGTHPELLHLNKAIEMRRQRRTQLVEMWFEQQEQQYERVAKAEEFAAWSIWRSSCAGLRRDMMDEYSRKRRRLDREKRTLDAPRPARRHQIFETELVRNPDRLHISLDAAALDTAEPGRTGRGTDKAGRKQSAKRKALAREIEAGDEFLAYPDLKGLAEADVMMDIEQMGIRPVGVPPGMYDPFYGAPPGLELQNPEIYAMYGPDAAAAAAAAAQAQMNGFPYGLPPGARGMPPPPPGMMGPGTPGSVHTPGRHGMHPLPAPPGHMHPGMEMGMMGFDPYAAAEMERAARMHHREQQARMGMDPNDPHHRSSPFLPDMYPPYPPHFNLPPGAGPGPMGPGARGMSNMPPSPTPPHRSSGGRKERASVDDGIHISGRGRGAPKTSGRSKQARPSQGSSAAPAITSPTHTKPSTATKQNLPPPPSMAAEMMADERDMKPTSNGAARGAPKSAASGAFAPTKGTNGGAPAATPVAVAASAGVGNTRLYPPSQ